MGYVPALLGEHDIQQASAVFTHSTVRYLSTYRQELKY